MPPHAITSSCFGRPLSARTVGMDASAEKDALIAPWPKRPPEPPEAGEAADTKKPALQTRSEASAAEQDAAREAQRAAMAAQFNGAHQAQLAQCAHDELLLLGLLLRSILVRDSFVICVHGAVARMAVRASASSC